MKSLQNRSAATNDLVQKEPSNAQGVEEEKGPFFGGESVSKNDAASSVESKPKNEMESFSVWYQQWINVLLVELSTRDWYQVVFI